jgi:hypothetical protein
MIVIQTITWKDRPMIAIPLVLLFVIAPLMAARHGVDSRPGFAGHPDR